LAGLGGTPAFAADRSPTDLAIAVRPASPRHPALPESRNAGEDMRRIFDLERAWREGPDRRGATNGSCFRVVGPAAREPVFDGQYMVVAIGVIRG
jgi:hypothetical protein